MAATAMAQSRSTTLNIMVASVEGDDLTGQTVKVEQTDWSVSYPSVVLDADGKTSVKVYPGPHTVSVERSGFETASASLTVDEGQTEASVSLQLTEKTRTPYALSVATTHDVFTGKNTLNLSWNTEPPVFFDDFESYDGWSVSFGAWTGIDGDMVAAAPLLGNYPNRGVMQYAQIINPLTVEPTWWYDYPILRPYEGSQYVGFTRTGTGVANDDWLITPAVTPGTDDYFAFMGKAADQFPELFMVYVTTQTDNPQPSDFRRLDAGNYETADHTGWRRYAYSLADYAGQPVKLAIRYISEYNRYGSFMLMVDNVYVGQLTDEPQTTRAKRLRRSPANPNEHFNVFLDGLLAGTTDGYSFTIDDVAPGLHTVGVQALYKAAQTDVVTKEVSVAAEGFSHVTFTVTADSKLSPDGQVLNIVNAATTDSYQLTVADGKAELASLADGRYLLSVEEGAFEAHQQTVEVSGDCEVSIALTDHIITPFNVIAKTGKDGELSLSWNQMTAFVDSFEDYDDFATGTFGDWLSIDNDHLPVYPIALGSQTNLVTFPGSATSAANPTAIAPMVFNPWTTKPAMLPTDEAIAAPTGKKTVIFFSPQQARADKWLISPLFDIYDGYKMSVKAKGYAQAYPESMTFCVSNGSTAVSDFVALAEASPLTSTQWSLYEVDLKDFADQQIRIGIHYTSYDAFLAQIDDFTVGNANGLGEAVDFGNVVRFDIFLDDEKIGESTTLEFSVSNLPQGHHTVKIIAVYQSGQSEAATVEVSIVNTVETVSMGQTSRASYFTLQGTPVSPAATMPQGVYVVRNGDKTRIEIRRNSKP
mgnify:CR=1 FL=1